MQLCNSRCLFEALMPFGANVKHFVPFGAVAKVLCHCEAVVPKHYKWHTVACYAVDKTLARYISSIYKIYSMFITTYLVSTISSIYSYYSIYMTIYRVIYMPRAQHAINRPQLHSALVNHLIGEPSQATDLLLLHQPHLARKMHKIIFLPHIIGWNLCMFIQSDDGCMDVSTCTMLPQ